MSTSEIKIFYSWQSDLPSKDTRGLIGEGIKKAVRKYRNTVEIDADSDTRGETGSPDIVQTIFSKIDNCDIFIADVSIINKFYLIDGEKRVLDSVKCCPNPNVLIELGYAIQAVGWENILCVFNSDYGDIEDLPFDIDHHRVTAYSTEKETKADIKNKICDYIGAILDRIQESGKRVKSKFSNIIVGSYLYDDKTISRRIKPLNLQTLEYSKNFLEEQYDVSRELYQEISNITIPPVEEIEEVNAQRQEKSRAITTPNGVTLSYPINNFTDLNFRRARAVKLDATEKDILCEKMKEYFDINLEENFFYLGGLKKYVSFLPYEEVEIVGTEAEKEKYEKIQELEYRLLNIWVFKSFIHIFSDILIFPLAIKNDSALADKDISIYIQVDTDTADIIIPSKKLVPSELQGLEGEIYEQEFIKNVMKMRETAEIQYDDDISYSPEDLMAGNGLITGFPGINGDPVYNEEDYERELQKYLATPMEESKNEFEFYIESMHAKETKWLGRSILLKPKKSRIELLYTIKSYKSDGELSGTLVYEC